MKLKLFIVILFIISAGKSFSQNNLYLLAKVAYENGENQKAIDLLGSFLEQHPKYSNALFLKAKACLEIGKYKQIVDLEPRLKPSYNNEVLLLQSRAYAGMGNHKEAIRLIEAYLRTSPKYAEKLIVSYPEFAKIQEKIEWKNLWEKDNYTRKEQWFINISYAIKTEHWGEAMDRADELVIKYPTSHQANYVKGDLLMREGNYKEAQKHFEIAAKIKSKKDEYLFKEALCNTRFGKSKKAIGQFDYLLGLDSLYLSAYLGRAEALMNNNDLDEATQDILKYRAYYPNDEEARLLHARISSKNGDFISAIRNYGKLIKGNPANVEYYLGRADSYVATKTYKYAIRDFSMALDIEPRNIEIYKKKAMTHKLSGQMEYACNAWKRAAKLGDVESRDMVYKYCKTRF